MAKTAARNRTRSLKQYRAKRNFSSTPEPTGKEKPKRPRAKPKGLFFCVQKHLASHLHYDFRLEHDGVLLSWAVPKGPSLNPADKRLAMRVEDHPLDYGDFEGNIPQGNYGGGSVMLWDRGHFELIGDESGAAQIARGDLKFQLDGVKLKGTFAIVHMKKRGKGNEWLLIKKRDEFADPQYDVEALAYSVKTGRTQEEIARDLPAKKKLPQGYDFKSHASAAVAESPAPKKAAVAKKRAPAAEAEPRKRATATPSAKKAKKKL